MLNPDPEPDPDKSRPDPQNWLYLILAILARPRVCWPDKHKIVLGPFKELLTTVSNKHISTVYCMFERLYLKSAEKTFLNCPLFVF